MVDSGEGRWTKGPNNGQALLEILISCVFKRKGEESSVREGVPAEGG